jgi:hypothetical protein
LKKHNTHYANIAIRPADDVDLPADGSVLERLPHIHCARGENHTDGRDDPSSSSIDSSSFILESLSEEHNVFVPDFHPQTYEVDAIDGGMQELRITAPSGDPLPWPPFGLPLSEYATDGLFTMAFPTLFPLGKAEYFSPRQKRLELYKWAKHLIRYRDSQFATHPCFCFFALNLIFRHHAMSRGKFLFSRQAVEVDNLNYSFPFGSLPADSTVASFGSDASI